MHNINYLFMRGDLMLGTIFFIVATITIVLLFYYLSQYLTNFIFDNNTNEHDL